MIVPAPRRRTSWEDAWAGRMVGLLDQACQHMSEELADEIEQGVSEVVSQSRTRYMSSIQLLLSQLMSRRLDEGALTLDEALNQEASTIYWEQGAAGGSGALCGYSHVAGLPMLMCFEGNDGADLTLSAQACERLGSLLMARGELSSKARVVLMPLLLEASQFSTLDPWSTKRLGMGLQAWARKHPAPANPSLEEARRLLQESGIEPRAAPCAHGGKDTLLMRATLLLGLVIESGQPIEDESISKPGGPRSNERIVNESAFPLVEFEQLLVDIDHERITVQNHLRALEAGGAGIKDRDLEIGEARQALKDLDEEAALLRQQFPAFAAAAEAGDDELQAYHARINAVIARDVRGDPAHMQLAASMNALPLLDAVSSAVEMCRGAVFTNAAMHAARLGGKDDCCGLSCTARCNDGATQLQVDLRSETALLDSIAWPVLEGESAEHAWEMLLNMLDSLGARLEPVVTGWPLA